MTLPSTASIVTVVSLVLAANSQSFAGTKPFGLIPIQQSSNVRTQNQPTAAFGVIKPFEGARQIANTGPQTFGSSQGQSSSDAGTGNEPGGSGISAQSNGSDERIFDVFGIQGSSGNGGVGSFGQGNQFSGQGTGTASSSSDQADAGPGNFGANTGVSTGSIGRTVTGITGFDNMGSASSGSQGNQFSQNNQGSQGGSQAGSNDQGSAGSDFGGSQGGTQQGSSDQGSAGSDFGGTQGGTQQGSTDQGSGGSDFGGSQDGASGSVFEGNQGGTGSDSSNTFNQNGGSSEGGSSNSEENIGGSFSNSGGIGQGSTFTNGGSLAGGQGFEKGTKGQGMHYPYHKPGHFGSHPYHQSPDHGQHFPLYPHHPVGPHHFYPGPPPPHFAPFPGPHFGHEHFPFHDHPHVTNHGFSKHHELSPVFVAEKTHEEGHQGAEVYPHSKIHHSHHSRSLQNDQVSDHAFHEKHLQPVQTHQHPVPHHIAEDELLELPNYHGHQYVTKPHIVYPAHHLQPVPEHHAQHEHKEGMTSTHHYIHREEQAQHIPTHHVHHGINEQKQPNKHHNHHPIVSDHGASEDKIHETLNKQPKYHYVQKSSGKHISGYRPSITPVQSASSEGKTVEQEPAKIPVLEESKPVEEKQNDKPEVLNAGGEIKKEVASEPDIKEPQTESELENAEKGEKIPVVEKSDSEPKSDYGPLISTLSKGVETGTQDIKPVSEAPEEQKLIEQTAEDEKKSEVVKKDVSEKDEEKPNVFTDDKKKDVEIIDIKVTEEQKAEGDIKTETPSLTKSDETDIKEETQKTEIQNPVKESEATEGVKVAEENLKCPGTVTEKSSKEEKSKLDIVAGQLKLKKIKY